MANEKKQYLVIKCAHCNRFLLAISSNETRTCSYCGKRLRLDHVKVLACSEIAKEARLVLQDLKAKES